MTSINVKRKSLHDGLGAQKLTICFCLLAMIPVFLVAKNTFIALAQAKDVTKKRVNKLSFEKEPIEIIKVTANGKEITFGETFTDADEWLKDFTIKFKNVSEKTITYLSADLIFKETKIDAPPLAYSLYYGFSPKDKSVDKNKLKLMRPGDIDEMAISGAHFEKLKRFVALKKDLNELTTADLTIQLVYFDDGMKWAGGDLWRPDPARPGSFIVASEWDIKRDQ